MSNTAIREEINQRIVSTLEKGTTPWRKPWSSGLPSNVISRKEYRGINTMLLQIRSIESSFESNFWGTFKQWSDLGLRVKKRPVDIGQGAWGTGIVFFQWRTTTKVIDGEEEEISYPLLRYYTVFNLDQVEGDGIERFQKKNVPGANIHEESEKLLEKTNIKVRHGGPRAYYNADLDYVQLPVMRDFVSTESYYGTKFHEFAHATGHSSRLNRLPLFIRFGSEAYAMEELVADLAGCYLQAHMGLPITDLENHASYLGHWIKVLKSDSKAIFQATSAASKAADWILGQRSEKEYDGEDENTGKMAQSA